MATIYKIIFTSQSKYYEIYAKNVYQGDMFGFIEIDNLIFNQSDLLVLNPAEEKLKQEFAGVKKIYVPLHTILRIDEVEKEGNPRIVDAGNNSGNITNFPGANILSNQVKSDTDKNNRDK